MSERVGLGATRDHTSKFSEKRQKCISENHKDVERAVLDFRKLSLAVNSVSNNSGVAGFNFWQKNGPPVTHLDPVDPATVTNCPVCKNTFKSFFSGVGMGLRKQQCLNCGEIVCSNCNQKSLPVQVLANNSIKDIKVCDKCHTILTKETEKRQLKKYIEGSATSPFTLYYEEMFFIISVVEKEMPKFKKIANSVPLTPTSLQAGRDLDENIGLQLHDFDREMKKLPLFKCSTPKQQLLQDKIKYLFSQFATITAPEYRLLKKQFENAKKLPLAPDPPPLPPPSAEAMAAAHANIAATGLATPPPGSPVTYGPIGQGTRRAHLSKKFSSITSMFSSPTSGHVSHNDLSQADVISDVLHIDSINPVVCPLQGGTTITILGGGFDRTCKAQIGGVDCPIIQCLPPDKLVVESPPMSVSEPKDVCVYSGQDRCVLSQILYYASDEMFASSSDIKKPQENPSQTQEITDFSGSNTTTNKPGHRRSNSHTSALDLPSSSSSSSSSPSSIPPRPNTVDNARRKESAEAKTLPPPERRFEHLTKHLNHDMDMKLSVELINPVVSPLQGTQIQMLVKGTPAAGMMIKVDGKQVKPIISENDPNTIRFQAPPLSTAGTKTVELVNSDGTSTVLEDILLYQDMGDSNPKKPSASTSSKETETTSSRTESVPIVSTRAKSHSFSKANTYNISDGHGGANFAYASNLPTPYGSLKSHHSSGHRTTSSSIDFTPTYSSSYAPESSLSLAPAGTSRSKSRHNPEPVVKPASRVWGKQADV
eukprot:TRINITY_DN4690_c0_g1_i1.p1 TRINITY_DN4690_c0_g1~~TRINITY_DN4690_c0_g1_i1.p1  ORF type:complete len:765 (-),score=224.79 TRINITY_DN4690_c0_g1_i1:13-2307(-)